MALSNNLAVFEILELASKKRAKNDKIQELRKHENNMALRDVLQGTFDSRIQWNLPTGPVPYTPSSAETPPSTLSKSHMQFKYFVKGLRDSEKLLGVKRERMFIDMLESIHPRDAEVVVAMINKKPPMKGITAKLVKEAFPDLIVE
jgi:hypothetical protein